MTISKDSQDRAYQKNDRNVQAEGDQAVQEEGEEADIVDLSHRDLGNLPDKSHTQVHGSADRGEVVQRDQRVHLVLGRAQQTLDHGKAEGLEDDACNLVEEANKDELDLAERGNHDTDNDRRDVQEDLQAGLRHTQGPTGKEDCNGSRSLEHLDKGDTQVQVGQVAEDQTQAEHDSNRDNGPQVHASGHLNGLAPIEHRRVTGKQLCHDGREDQVISRQNDRIV